MKRTTGLIPLVLFGAVTAVLLWQLTRNTAGDSPALIESALIGQKIPAFRLPSLIRPEQMYHSSELAQGRPQLLNIWASWCQTCRAEHGFLTELAARGVAITGINYRDTPGRAVAWLDKLRDPYRLTLIDERGMVSLDLGIAGTPETFLIDGNGIIRYRHSGALTPQVWQEELLPLWRQYGGEGGE